MHRYWTGFLFVAAACGDPTEPPPSGECALTGIPSGTESEEATGEAGSSGGALPPGQIEGIESPPILPRPDQSTIVPRPGTSPTTMRSIVDVPDGVVDALASGADFVELTIPDPADGAIAFLDVEWERVETLPELPCLLISADPTSGVAESVGQIDAHVYTASIAGPNGAITEGIMIATSDRGAKGQVQDVNGPALSFVLRGDESPAQLEADTAVSVFTEPERRPLATGAELRNGELVQCQDGIDNDADAALDACDGACLHHNDFGCEEFLGDHTHRNEEFNDFAVFGTERWCSLRGDLWCGDLYASSLMAASLLNNIEELPPDWSANVRVTQATCWSFPDPIVADDCRPGLPSCPISEEDYPFGDRDGEALWPAAWEAFDQSARALADAGVEVLPVEMTVVQDNTSGVAGSAGATFNPFAFGSGTANFIGSVVVGTNVSNRGIGGTIAHELGHTMGLAHEASGTGFMRKGSGGQPSLGIADLTDASGNGPNFGVQFPTLMGDQSAAFNITSRQKDGLPRPNGFGFTGCQQNSTCQPNGWPGTCNTERTLCEYGF